MKYSIIDDGSTDETPIIVDELRKTIPRIRYHRNNSNVGLPMSRNIAVSLAKGDFVFFIEDDLILEPDCLLNLIDGFDCLAKEGHRVGAVAPRLIEAYRKSPNQIG